MEARAEHDKRSEQARKNQAAIELLRSWREAEGEDAEEQRETGELLMEALGLRGTGATRVNTNREEDTKTAIELLRSLREGDAAEQRETGEYLMRVLDEDRLSYRKLYP